MPRRSSTPYSGSRFTAKNASRRSLTHERAVATTTPPHARAALYQYMGGSGRHMGDAGRRGWRGQCDRARGHPGVDHERCGGQSRVHVTLPRTKGPSCPQDCLKNSLAPDDGEWSAVEHRTLLNTVNYENPSASLVCTQTCVVITGSSWTT